MQGSTYKRCPCPARRDARGRRVPCGKAHGSWSYKVDVPSDDGRRRQLTKGGFATKRDAEQAMAELPSTPGRPRSRRAGLAPASRRLLDRLARGHPTDAAAGGLDQLPHLRRPLRPAVAVRRASADPGAHRSTSPGTLSVTTQRTTDTDYRIITKAPKGTGRRPVDLGEGRVAALRAHRQAQLADVADLYGLLLTASVDGPEYVFVAEDLQPLHPQRLTDLFQHAARDAGVPVIRLHDARHSCATLALDAGVHPKVVQQLLGHSSWSTTMDRYSHRVDRLQREATQRIEGLLLPPKEATGGSGIAEAG
jgi:integrase